MRNGILPSLLLCLSCAYGLSGFALEMEYISPDMKQQLESQFEKADFSSKAADTIKQKQWTCDMYGVRTRLQVKRGVKLYNWKKSDWQNDGAQIVRDYQAGNNGLIGSTGKLEDEVKINAKGKLISRLTLTEPKREVVAYAVCDTP